MSIHYPPPIFSTEPGTWAHSTITERLPKIAQRVIDENNFPTEIVGEIKILQKEITEGKIRPLGQAAVMDLEAWQSYIQPYQGESWLKVPWFFAEHYFYRRIMEAVNFFSDGIDPFHFQKEQGLLAADQDIHVLADHISERIKDLTQKDQILRESIYSSLWGNQVDLSIWPAGYDRNQNSQKHLKDQLLADDSRQLIKTLHKTSLPVERVDIMLDNAGFELACDLILGLVLLDLGFTKSLVLHVKAHPTFVSDAIARDVEYTIHYLDQSKTKSVKALGERLDFYHQEEKLQIKPDFFWNSPLAMWELPASLKEDLVDSTLLISKGDANYRRILGDREWDFTEPFHQVVDYLPVPLAALRTIKAELVVGMNLDQIQEVFNQDPKWMTNGNWGVIHFAGGSG
jgi:uncharacterized protein with ATP-grasp and redox domains